MMNVLKPKGDDIVCVVGAGAVGLAALMALRLSPSPPKKVIAVDIVPERLGLAKKYGATDVINSREHDDLKTALLEVTKGKGVDGTIDTTGRPEIVANLLKATAKKGMVVQVGVGQASLGLKPFWYFSLTYCTAGSRGFNMYFRYCQHWSSVSGLCNG
jgi:aryl-alcohol dehydrogenase